MKIKRDKNLPQLIEECAGGNIWQIPSAIEYESLSEFSVYTMGLDFESKSFVTYDQTGACTGVLAYLNRFSDSELLAFKELFKAISSLISYNKGQPRIPSRAKLFDQSARQWRFNIWIKRNELRASQIIVMDLWFKTFEFMQTTYSRSLALKQISSVLRATPEVYALNIIYEDDAFEHLIGIEQMYPEECKWGFIRSHVCRGEMVSFFQASYA